MLLWTPGIGELFIILLIVLLFAGKKRLPDLARSIGSGITEFRKGLSGQIDPDEDDEPETNVKHSSNAGKNADKKGRSGGQKKS